MYITNAILKKLRANKNITLEELVKDVNEKFNANLTINKITRWENGKLEPEYSELKYMASYYNVTADFLFGFNIDEFVHIIDLRDDLEISKMLYELEIKLREIELSEEINQYKWQENI